MSSFPDFPLAAPLLQALEALGFAEPTAIQSAALPAILERRDLVAQAPTGSGKTVAFALGLLQSLDAALIAPQALVLCPTRELADQVARSIRRLATAIPNLKVQLLTGGVAIEPQRRSLKRPAQVVVGTPGRVQELIDQQALSFARLRTLVLDEADRMLDMGFEEAIRAIVSATPAARQTLMFSATFPPAFRAIAADLLRDPAEVRIESAEQRPAITQRFVEVEPARRIAALTALLLAQKPESALVFCNTRRDVDEVAGRLLDAGIDALALHGDLEQRDRDEVLLRFAHRSLRVLVASDVAARGLDVAAVGLVLNYELPSDADIYTHRIGRTGRAGHSGLAISLCTPQERTRAAAIAGLAEADLDWMQPKAAAKPGADGLHAAMTTLRLDAGRTDKMRPGDILGALTGDGGLAGSEVGKIDVLPTRSYVAVPRARAKDVLAHLRERGIKGRKVRVAFL